MSGRGVVRFIRTRTRAQDIAWLHLSFSWLSYGTSCYLSEEDQEQVRVQLAHLNKMSSAE